jgi:hypothetical protein
MNSKGDVLDNYVGAGENRTQAFGEMLANQIAEAEVAVEWLSDGFALSVDDGPAERLTYPVTEEDLNEALTRLSE